MKISIYTFSFFNKSYWHNQEVKIMAYDLSQAEELLWSTYRGEIIPYDGADNTLKFIESEEVIVPSIL